MTKNFNSEKHFNDTDYIYCERAVIDKGVFNCNIYHWEQGLTKKVKEKFQVRIKTIHMGDVIKSQLIDAENLGISISLKRSEKDNIIKTTHCYLVGLEPQVEYGKRTEARGITCIPEVRHVDDKS